MEFTLKIQCWQCTRPFHNSAKIDDDKKISGVMVDVIKPCPYCQTSNQYTVDAAMADTSQVYLGDKQTEAPLLAQHLPKHAFLHHILTGHPVPEISNQK